MDPIGELRTIQTDTTIVADQVIRLAKEVLEQGTQSDALARALTTLRGDAHAVLLAVAVEDYEVGESLHVALHGIAAVLGQVLLLPLADADRRRFEAVDAVLAGLRLRVLDDIQQPHRPSHGSPSVGFEWQTDIKVDLKPSDPLPPSKTLLKRWRNAAGDEILRLELDGPELEFVTLPVTTMAALEEQIEAILAEVRLLAKADVAGHDYALPEPALSDETGAVLFKAGHVVHVRHHARPRGALQATTARKLDRVTDLLVTYGGVTARSAIATIDDYYENPPLPGVAPLLYLIRYYVDCLAYGTPDDQGPKVLLPVMCRTDFHSAYLLLDEAERADFRRCVFHGKEAEGDLAFLGLRITGKGLYKGPAGATYRGPTVGEWYNSIVDGCPTSLEHEPVDRDNDGEGPRGNGRDLLSPPRGYPAHRKGRHFTYAMGHYGTAADGSLLFELRWVGVLPADGHPAATNYSDLTVANAMREFARAELGVAPPAPDREGDGQPRQKRRRTETS